MADAKPQIDAPPDGGATSEGVELSPRTLSISNHHHKSLKRVAGYRHKAHSQEHAHGDAHGHAEKEPFILTAVASAVINFLLMFGLCCAYGIIMFDDTWNSQHRGLGVKMNLCSALIVGLLLAVGSKMGVAIGGPDLNPVVFLGMFVQTLADEIAREQGLTIPNGKSRRLLESFSGILELEPLEVFRRLGPSDDKADFCTGYHLVKHRQQCDTYHDQLRATTIFAVSVSSLILGLLFFCLGRLRMTRLVTYVPTNIMEAFLSCVGYKVFKYALKFCKYKPQQFIPAMCVGVPLYFMKAMHVGNPAIVIPLVLFVPLGIFYAALFGTGGSVETARSAGWMFDELENSDFWSVWTDSLGRTGDINFKAWTATLVDLVVMIIVCMLDCMLKVSSTENKLPVEVDTDYEVTLYGIGNFLTTCCGASVGYMQLKFNVINFGVLGNVKDRRAGVLYALLCGIFFFWTTDLFNYLPRFFLSTLLFFAGSGFVAENLWGSRMYLSTTEWLQIFIILAVFILADSLLYAVVVGMTIAGLTFIYRYAKIPCVIGRPMFGGEGRSIVHRNFLVQKKIEHVANSRVLVIRLKGYIFFASAQNLIGWVLHHMEKQNGLPAYKRTRFIIFDFSNLDGLDSSASKSFGKVAKAAKHASVVVLWSGMSKGSVKRLKSCHVIGDDSQVYATLSEARQSVEMEIKNYLDDLVAKWVSLHPMLQLAHDSTKERLTLEPFEDILKLDTARFGCPWQYCSHVKIKRFSTLLWQHGEKARTLFLVHSGRVGLFENIPEDHREHWQMPEVIYTRGQLLNREALFNVPANMNAVALENGVVLCWSEVQWARMARECPPMAAAIVQALMQQDHVGPRHYKDHVASWKTVEAIDDTAMAPMSPSKPLQAPDRFHLDDVHAAATHLHELHPWMHGLHVTKGLAKLGLFDPAEAGELRLTATMRKLIERDLAFAFQTFNHAPESNAPESNADSGSKEAPANDRADVIPADKVSEALMYAGLFGLRLKKEREVHDLTQAEFISLGIELSVMRLSAQQIGTLESIYRKGTGEKEGASMTRAAMLRLLREEVAPGLTVEEVEDSISFCGGASERHVSSETFLAMMARMVRKHERDWCVLLGVRQLLGATESDNLGDRLRASMLVENGKGKLTQQEAEEMLWSADICNDRGNSLDMRMIGLALWPCSVPALALPPEPRSCNEDCHSPGELLHQLLHPEDAEQRHLQHARSVVEDIRCQSTVGGSVPSRMVFVRAEQHLVQQMSTKRPTEEEDFETEMPAYPDTCRAKVNLFLDNPQSSPAASRWSVVMGMFIMISVITLFLEPLISPKDEPEDPTEKAVWQNFERVFTLVFTAEFLLRFSVADALGTQTYIGFLQTPMNVCDLLAVLPWYVDMAFGSDQEQFRLLRIVRLTRLAQLVRLGRLARRSAMFAPIAVILVTIWGIFMKNSL